MQDYEKLASFYLGKEYDGEARQILDNLILYDARDLTTHALCVGMTGSGKTGLCVSLLEEAALDGIPAIIIDPKGDMPNLMLRFPKLAPKDFRPWIDDGAATRAGQTPDEFAATTAKQWREGLAGWGQTPERIRRLSEACDMRIWTPGSSAGHQLSVIRSFAVPPAAILEDPEALQSRIGALVGGLLGLIGIDADIRMSREAVLLANILQNAWAAGRDLDLATLIRRIQDPGFETLGVLDLESMYPRKDRFELAMALNNLLASPGFATWREGEPLDMSRLLSAPDGRPRLSILSIAHLNDEQRMFFVTLLLNEVIAWMRTQSGTGSLRAILYMDEIMGYFPPSKNPPSKQPMLTLLKQARAFGVGVLLATQNPVDLDYKGLSNTGTWLVGRLQTERDKLRLMDGLSSAGGNVDTAKLERQLSGLGKRVFLMHNIHEDEPVLFHTRWAMSYLRGPMTRPQIEALTTPQKSNETTVAQSGQAPPVAVAKATDMVATTAAASTESDAAPSEPPVLPDHVEQAYLSISEPLGRHDRVIYAPLLFGTMRLHYALSRARVDCWTETGFIAPLNEGMGRDAWSDAEQLSTPHLDCEPQPEIDADYADVPTSALRDASYKTWLKQLTKHAYRVADGYVCWHRDTKTYSELNADEAAFALQVRHLLREARDVKIEKLRKKFAPKIAALESRIMKAEQRVEREKAQATQQGFQTALSIGSTILGALFGRKKASVSKATTALRGAGRVARERGDIGRAQESLEALQDQQQALEADFESQAAELESTEIDPTFERVTIRPKKADISIQRFGVLWLPMKQTELGRESLARLTTIRESN